MKCRCGFEGVARRGNVGDYLCLWKHRLDVHEAEIIIPALRARTPWWRWPEALAFLALHWWYWR